ncbi:MAG: hypothetical protein GF364_21665, partial [Candidatus Lokiarchaeota archaeon]|nr:hypothetical protein [Candidatus Lokiarchaeota archaeon]
MSSSNNNKKQSTLLEKVPELDNRNGNIKNENQEAGLDQILGSWNIDEIEDIIGKIEIADDTRNYYLPAVEEKRIRKLLLKKFCFGDYKYSLKTGINIIRDPQNKIWDGLTFGFLAETQQFDIHRRHFRTKILISINKKDYSIERHLINRNSNSYTVRITDRTSNSIHNFNNIPESQNKLSQILNIPNYKTFRFKHRLVGLKSLHKFMFIDVSGLQDDFPKIIENDLKWYAFGDYKDRKLCVVLQYYKDHLSEIQRNISNLKYRNKTRKNKIAGLRAELKHLKGLKKKVMNSLENVEITSMDYVENEIKQLKKILFENELLINQIEA